MGEDLQYCSILGVNINVTTMEKTVEYIQNHLCELKGDYICVSNVHTTVMAYRNEEYKAVQNGGAMAIPDGKPLSIVCQKRGYKEAGRVPGPDLMPEIFKLSEERGYRHFFYGSKQSTLDALKEELKKKYPKLNIVGMYSPPFRPLSEEEDLEEVAMINAAEPDFVWVGLGAPKQENWMAAHKGRVNGLMLGVGAGFDFHAGTVKRAPKWMQEMCLEWLFRLMQDPKRLLPRYFDTNLSFIWYTSKEGRKLRKLEKQRYKAGKLKIAMIGHKRIPSREGGVEIVVQELATRMVDEDYSVVAYNRSGYHVSGKEFDESKSKFFKGIRIYTIPTFQNGKLNAIVYSFLATMHAVFRKYDIYHYHAEGPCAMLGILKLFRKRIVVTIHGLDWQRAKWGNFATRVLKYGEKQAAKHADEIIVLSKNVQDYFKKTYNRDTLYIPNGVNRPELQEAKEITEKWGLKKDEYILFLARIVPEKGVHYLLEAFADVVTDKKLVIAGGSSHSNEYMNQITEMAGKDPRVVMTYFVQGRKLEELYSNAYAFVLPSDIEGMAISLLEAMSYGNCCVVSDIPENTEVVGVRALTFEKGNVEDLRRVLQEIVDHPDKVDEYRRQSADYICEKYHWNRVVSDTTDIYWDILEKKKGKRKAKKDSYENTDC